MVSNDWNAHNHGSDEGSGMSCGEKPIGKCIREAKDAERAELLAEVERLGRQLSTAKADAHHWHSGFDDMKAEAWRLHEEAMRAQELHSLARAADAATIEAAERALAVERAKVARVEALLHEAVWFNPSTGKGFVGYEDIVAALDGDS